MSAPVERKVQAASLTTLVTSFIVYEIVTNVPFLSGQTTLVQGLVGGVVTGAFAFVAGWLAKHTPRPPSSDQTYRPGRM
jgi:hypothetical protein